MERVDLAIIGGGIAGVGIAQRAVAGGYSVCLLEQGELGSQTSANSSKLIHGGLRYLETAQLTLVRASLRERDALLTLAPSLVKPVPFYIPIYADSQRSRWEIRAGLSLYALLSELKPLGRFRSLPPVQWSSLKGLKLDGLRAVFQYWDAQTDDRALTRAVADSAASLGANILTQANCEGIIHDPTACLVSYRHQGQEYELTAAAVINAAGPWVNRVLTRVRPAIPLEDIDWVQGSHLLLDIPAPDGILYLESCFDKRVIFVMPWQGKTLVGTTELTLSQLPDRPEITEAETEYLLGIYNRYFPNAGDMARLRALILGSFCGVRVLPRQAASAFERPRDTQMSCHASHPRILTLYGGKLTTFRHTANEALAWLQLLLGPREAIADVGRLRLGP